MSDLPFDGNRYLQRFLTAVYNRRIENATDVMPHICWEAMETGNPLDSTICHLFFMWLVCWMSGIGHPCSMLEDSHITAEIYERDQRDQGL
jgi:hypothetical protein